MRRLVKIALVALGIRWFLRWRKHRQKGRDEAELTAPAPATTAPADELRQKLAASRAEEAEEPEPAPASTVADRRAEVHEQGRAALDEMTSSDEG